MKKRNFVRNYGILTIIRMAVFFIIATFAGVADGQQPDRGFQTANTYAATGLEVVNTTNGNIMLNIPLASLPKGRGTSPGYSITLQYDSKLWESHQTFRDDDIPDEYGNEVYNLSSINRSPNGGWKVRNAYELQLTNRLDFESPNPCWIGDPVEHLDFIWKLEMVMPSGNIVQFFPETERGPNVGMGADGYANISPNGHSTVSTLYSDPNCNVQQSHGYSNNGMNYISMDGTHLRLAIPYSPTNAALWTRNWKLYYPDGTLVENVPGSGVEQRITDRNGNFVEHRNGKIIDQLGRYIEFDSDGNDQIIRVKGVNGEAVETRIKWSYSGNWVHHKFHATNSASAPQNLRYDYVNDQAAPMVEKIIFPSQLGDQSLKFEYNGDATQPDQGDYTDGWGEISKITVPTGAYSTFEYGQDGQGGDETLAEDVLSRYATGKVLHYNEQYDGQSTQKTAFWAFTVGRSGNSVLGPNGASSGNALFYNSSYSSWETGLAYGGSNPDGSVTNRIWAQNIPYAQTAGWMPPGQNAGIGKANSYVKTEFTTLRDANGNISNDSLVAIKDYKYDKNGNVLEIKEYDWVTRGSLNISGGNYTGVPSGVTLKRKTVNTYYNQAADADSTGSNSNSYSNPSSPVLKNVIKSTEILDSGNIIKARTEYYYDDPNSRGNLIETRMWDSSRGNLNQADQQTGSKLGSNNSISTHTTYDSYGNPILQTNARGYRTHFTYGTIKGPEGSFDGLYPTQTVTAYETPAQRTASNTYDFYTGLTLSTRDEDNELTSATEYDALGRPVKVITAQDTDLESWVRMEYSSQDRRMITRTDIETKGDGKKVSIQHYDELGRVRLSRTLENAATEDPENELQGIKVQTRYLFDNPANPEVSNGEYTLTSNPYRAATSSGASAETTMGWALGYINKTGKYSETTTFNGSGLPAPFSSSGANTSSTGTVISDRSAERTLMVDQAGKKRISKVNALGQLTNVWDVTPSDGMTVPLSFPGAAGAGISAGYLTSYNYDALGNLAGVTQGSQTPRSFTFNSLSRLEAAFNPESGTTNYLYDANGNLTSKSQLRNGSANVVTSYSYDPLNRVLQRSYSTPNGVPSNYQATPTVTYTYDDPNIAHSKGKLTKVSSSISTTEYTAFDLLGRVTAHKQTTEGRNFETGYAYNLSGALIEETYPSGRKVKNTFDVSGDFSKVESKKNSASGYWTYADAFTYNASGGVTSMQLGNGHWESTTFNARLQPTRIGLGTTVGGTDLLKLDYSYGTTENNGNVQSQTITVPTISGNAGFTAVQSYTYDALNRLYDATETAPSQTWKQTYSYDRFGNRRFDTQANRTTTLEANCLTAICNPEINQANNRLVGATYDSAGNTTIDSNSQQYIYDSENKIVQAFSGSDLLGTYYYDGDGRRIKKSLPGGETTVFVYDSGGKLITEYSTQLSQEPQVAYLTNDSLGTPRINTNAGGAVISRHDYHPFGEEISTSQRTSGLGYDSDEIRKKFTGYERDKESGLDFAQTRYFQSTSGRFNSPDDFLNDTRAAEPQSWNLYVYARNNPLKYTDPFGTEVLADDLTKAEREKLLQDWKDKTGYNNVYFDGNDKLVIDEKAGIRRNADGTKASSAAFRKQLSDAVNSDEKVFKLRAKNSSGKVGFAKISNTEKGLNSRYSAKTNERVEEYAVLIDFDDFGLREGDKDVKDAYSIGITVQHEFDHWLYGPGLVKDEPYGEDNLGPIERQYINPIRAELGLPQRAEYPAQHTKGDPNIVQLRFTLNGKDKFLRWNNSVVGAPEGK